MKSEDNEDDSENSERSGNNSGNNSKSSESCGNNSGNNSKNNSKNNSGYDKKLVDKSKELLEKVKKYDKKNTSTDEVLKRLDARAEDDRKTNEILKKYYAEEAQRASKEVKKFNKTINNNLDMSSEKSEIINRLIELHSLKQIYHLNKIDNNLKANENIDNILINREIHELEKTLRDLPKKGSGMFTS